MPRLQHLTVSVKCVGSKTLAVLQALAAPEKTLQCTHLSLQAQHCEGVTDSYGCLLADRIGNLSSLRDLTMMNCLLIPRRGSVANRSQCLFSQLTHLDLSCVIDTPVDWDMGDEDMEEHMHHVQDGAVGNADNAVVVADVGGGGNGGGGGGASQVVEGGVLGELSSMASLEHLVIACIELSEREVDALADQLACLSCLNSLKLVHVHTPIGCSHAQLTSALSALFYLTHLSLEPCCSLGELAGGLVNAAPNMSALCELSLCGSTITDDIEVRAVSELQCCNLAFNPVAVEQKIWLSSAHFAGPFLFRSLPHIQSPRCC